MPLRARLLPALLVVSLSSFACGGEPPTKEMQDAQTAIDAALAAGADKYAAEEYAFAQEALQHAKTAVGERDYRLALNNALDSRERAQSAAAEATTKKAAAKIASGRALTKARADLAAAQARLEGLGTPAPNSALATTHTAWTTADTHVQEAGAAFEQGDYLKADSETAAALQALQAVSMGLDAATPRRRR